MPVNIEVALLFSIAQDGERYVFGTEVPGTTSDRWDCSELVEVACRAAGIRPTVPDGAYYQWRHCTPITVEKGIHTRGALLFVGDGTGVGRDAITHVAWSLGNGTTIEARGTAWGVGVWPTADRFDFAGLVPGASYGQPAPFPIPAPPIEEDKLVISIKWFKGEPSAPGDQTDLTAAYRVLSARTGSGKLVDVEAWWIANQDQLAAFKKAGYGEANTRATAVPITEGRQLAVTFHGGPFNEDR